MLILNIDFQILIPTLWQSKKHWVLYVLDVRKQKIWLYNSLDYNIGVDRDIVHLVIFYL